VPLVSVSVSLVGFWIPFAGQVSYTWIRTVDVILQNPVNLIVHAPGLPAIPLN
jgi:hypothetical protein